MIIKEVEIDKFRSFENVSFSLGKYITAIAGRNATQKTTVLGMIGQPFTISKNHAMYGCKTIDGYNFRSQFREKFKISPTHDVIGEHMWKLNLYNNVDTGNYYAVKSIPRNQRGKEPTLRFWNAESRTKGAGYLQLPVYFLSLSRLFPIGESGKTKAVTSILSQEELEYCITNYRTILSIQTVSGEASVGIEKGTSASFAGVSDGNHDIFTNSAGEGNIMRIILAVLSFKRLQEDYGKEYKGGLLLIDEVDATLYGFSQQKLIDYLYKEAKQYKIQVVFTTHSPIVLRCVNKYQRKEYMYKGISLPQCAYDSSIVYLEPKYDVDGKRTIMPRNISTSSELNTIINDINLVAVSGGNKINIYCEDKSAISFLQFILLNALSVNLDLYMNFIDINLGWTNYVQLYEKAVPEFRNNIIVLDGDVPNMREYRSKERVISEAKNFMFLPLVLEKGIFELLKEHDKFIQFQNHYSSASMLNYDICFNEWPLESNKYNTSDYKHWYEHIINILGEPNILFRFWCDQNQEVVELFIAKFMEIFNMLAECNDVDALPPVNICGVNEPEDVNL